MARVSDWLAGARDEGGLLIPGDPAKHGCDLILRTDHVEVHAGEEAGAALAWEEFDSIHRPLDGVRDRWRFEAWATASAVEPLAAMAGSGLGIGVDGRCHVVTMPVMEARNTRRNRFNRSMAKGATVPLAPWSRISPTLAHNALMVDVLCAVLAVRPELRSGLVDPERVGALATDLERTPLELVTPPDGVRRETVEVLAALEVLGHRHPFGGRPLPGDPMPTLEEVLDRVLAHITANPRQDITVQPDRARAVIHEHYLDIEPWPFGAVTLA